MDLSLVDTDLVGACGLGDPRLPIFDDQVVCAAGHAVYSEFLIFCEIECLDDVSVDTSTISAGLLCINFAPRKRRTAAASITAIRIISCFFKSFCFVSLLSVIKNP